LGSQRQKSLCFAGARVQFHDREKCPGHPGRVGAFNDAPIPEVNKIWTAMPMTINPRLLPNAASRWTGALP
jgi:hypothetical protein